MVGRWIAHSKSPRERVAAIQQAAANNTAANTSEMNQHRPRPGKPGRGVAHHSLRIL